MTDDKSGDCQHNGTFSKVDDDPSFANEIRMSFASDHDQRGLCATPAAVQTPSTPTPKLYLFSPQPSPAHSRATLSHSHHAGDGTMLSYPEVDSAVWVPNTQEPALLQEGGMSGDYALPSALYDQDEGMSGSITNEADSVADVELLASRALQPLSSELLHNFVAHCRLQTRQLAELTEACRNLELEQRWLRRYAAVAEHITQHCRQRQRRNTHALPRLSRTCLYGSSNSTGGSDRSLYGRLPRRGTSYGAATPMTERGGWTEDAPAVATIGTRSGSIRIGRRSSVVPPRPALFSPANPTVEYTSVADEDEFDEAVFIAASARRGRLGGCDVACDAEDSLDVHIASPTSTRNETYTIALAGWEHGRRAFDYVTTAVPGHYTPVFSTGHLYCAIMADGAWHFVNDSAHYRMDVCYHFGGSSQLVAGPHTRLVRLISGAYTATMTLRPGESETLVWGRVNGYRNASRAVPLNHRDGHCGEGGMEAGVPRRVRAALTGLARRARRSSAAYLGAEEALQVCLQHAPTASDSSVSLAVTDSASELRTRASGLVADETPDERWRFVDPDFVPGYAALHGGTCEGPFLWPVPWRRPAEYLVHYSRQPGGDGPRAHLFCGAVLPMDACPGEGGDLYLCSAARILAEFPGRVRELFRHPVSAAVGRRERGCHAYRVTLNIGGWWHTVLIDDYLPASRRRPVFGHCGHDVRKLWYALLEKAYAKLHGSYAAIQRGDPLEALQDLTGFATSRIDDDVWAEAAAAQVDSDRATGLFDELQIAHQRGDLVCLSMPDARDNADTSLAIALGLQHGMTYNVLDLVHYANCRLVRLRCPTVTAAADCRGMWCPHSPRWRQYPQLARLCEGMNAATAGVAVQPADEVQAGAATPHAGQAGITKASVTQGDIAEAGTPAAAPATYALLSPTLTAQALWLDWSEALRFFDAAGLCHCRWGWQDYRVRGQWSAAGTPSVVLEVRVQRALDVYCSLSQGEVGATSTLLSPHHTPQPTLPQHKHDTVTELVPMMLCVSRALSSDVPDIRHEVHLCASEDARHAMQELGFVLGRDVTLRYSFAASPNPYYIIARARDLNLARAFTLGLLSPTPLHHSSWSVRFVRLADGCDIFRNMRRFTCADVMDAAVEASFQWRGTDGVVREGRANAIVP